MSRPGSRSLVLPIAFGLLFSAAATFAAPRDARPQARPAPATASFTARLGRTLIRLIGGNGAILDPFGVQSPPPKTGETGAVPLDDNGAILDPFGVH